jgi:hypothetical protein
MYLLIILSALYTFSYINQLKIFYSPLVGGIAFASTNLGILLAGTRGLGNDSFPVMDALSRIVLALFTVWKLSSDMRHLRLEINPYKVKRSKFSKYLYGILFPPKEFLRLLKVIVLIFVAYYFVMSGLNILEGENVDSSYLEKTEQISVNLLFLGIQTPMMMASRASVSKTFSDYLENLNWLEDSMVGYRSMNVNDSYRQILNSSEISYDSINSNGKHLWISVLLLVILQAFEKQILGYEYLLSDIQNLLKSIWTNTVGLITNFL